MDNLRVSELAKELNITSKELIEKFAEISISVKSHSNTVSPEQIRKIKEHLGVAPKKSTAKKAFIVKKAKPTEEPEVVKTSPKEPVKIERIERVQKIEKVSKIETIEKTPVTEPIEEEKPIKKAEKPVVRIERTKIEYPKNQSRIEIVRKAPARPTMVKEEKSDEKTERGDRKVSNKQNSDKKLVERRIIPQEIYEVKGGPSTPKKKGDNRKKDKDFNSKKENQEMISLEKAAAQKHKKRTQKEEEKTAVTSIIVNQPMTIQELADKIQKTPAEIVRFLMFQGIMATVNQLIDVETIKKVCTEYELEVLEEDIEAFMEEELEKEEKKKALTEVDKKLLKKRAPVVSIMGHVDHGKTTLLDSIRASKHKIVATEVGGITQSIGAYTVYLEDSENKKIVFVDTPGHEAFTEMRARGAKATDIAILVVAADDGIMPQTIEAINHARQANVPIIVACNKIDKVSANPDRVLNQLTEHGLLPEIWGGETPVVNVSAKMGTGVEELLENVLILAELRELKANPKLTARGTIIEARMDKGLGKIATVLVQSGTLCCGDDMIAGTATGRVKVMIDDKGKQVKKAGPSIPVSVTGWDELPEAGDIMDVVESDRFARDLAAERKLKLATKKDDSSGAVNLDDLFDKISKGELKTVKLIIKADVQGSLEAVKQSLGKLGNEEVNIEIIHGGVGAINESDVSLADTAKAIIIGFNVRPDANAKSLASQRKIDIRFYNVIYKAIEDIEAAVKGLLAPKYKEVVLGSADVREIFKISGVGTIAGCHCTDGKIVRGARARLIRNGKVETDTEIASLRHGKDDVKEIARNYDCGIMLLNYPDVKVDDVIEAYQLEQI